jgi:hypothetical protein
MILGPPQPQKTAGAGGRITLDDLFRAAVAQRPDHNLAKMANLANLSFAGGILAEQ